MVLSDEKVLSDALSLSVSQRNTLIWLLPLQVYQLKEGINIFIIFFAIFLGIFLPFC